MKNVISLSGASAGQQADSAWCIPSLTEQGGCHMPIVILVMSSDGPRDILTQVSAWVISGEDEKGQVELIARTPTGNYHRLLADSRALIEDGTAVIVLST